MSPRHRPCGIGQSCLNGQIESTHIVGYRSSRSRYKGSSTNHFSQTERIESPNNRGAKHETDNKNAFKDPAMFKRIAEIESLPEKDRECLWLTVDNFIKATKLNMI